MGVLARGAELEDRVLHHALDELEWQRWLAGDARSYERHLEGMNRQTRQAYRRLEAYHAARTAVCADLATGAPQGLRETKRLLAADLLARIDAGGAEMAALSARLFGSDEAREAMTAFLTRAK